MKTCSKCHEEKSIDEFYSNKSTKDGKQKSCKSCSNAYSKKHYNKNKQVYIDKAKLRAENLLQANRKELYSFLLKNPCVDCGETDIIVLQFDHINDKQYEISTMMKTHTWTSILKEIEKCEVVCGNDHIRRTAKRANWNKYQLFGDIPSLSE